MGPREGRARAEAGRTGLGRGELPEVEHVADVIKQNERGDWAPGHLYRPLYAHAFGKTEAELFGESERTSGEDLSADQAVDLATWPEQTNVRDGTIAYLAAGIQRLAFDYARRPPSPY